MIENFQELYNQSQPFLTRYRTLLDNPKSEVRFLCHFGALIFFVLKQPEENMVFWFTQVKQDYPPSTFSQFSRNHTTLFNHFGSVFSDEE